MRRMKPAALGKASSRAAADTSLRMAPKAFRTSSATAMRPGEVSVIACTTLNMTSGPPAFPRPYCRSPAARRTALRLSLRSPLS
eukprot:8229474-Alexandrium_andersonii.AAC.2